MRRFSLSSPGTTAPGFPATALSVPVQARGTDWNGKRPPPPLWMNNPALFRVSQPGRRFSPAKANGKFPGLCRSYPAAPKKVSSIIPLYSILVSVRLCPKKLFTSASPWRRHYRYCPVCRSCNIKHPKKYAETDQTGNLKAV